MRDFVGLVFLVSQETLRKPNQQATMENLIIIITFPEFFEQRKEDIDRYLTISLRHNNPQKLIKIFFLKEEKNLSEIRNSLGNELNGFNKIDPDFTIQFEYGNTGSSFLDYKKVLKIMVKCDVHPLSEKILFFSKT